MGYTMWLLLVLLAVIIGFSPSTAFAQDILIGRVVSVDGHAGVFVLDVQDCLGQTEFAGSQITVGIKDGNLSHRLVPGKLVRVWARPVGDDKDFLWAQRVSSLSSFGGGSDRTGVRYRLNRGSSFGRSGMSEGKGRHGQ